MIIIVYCFLLLAKTSMLRADSSISVVSLEGKTSLKITDERRYPSYESSFISTLEDACALGRVDYLMSRMSQRV